MQAQQRQTQNCPLKTWQRKVRHDLSGARPGEAVIRALKVFVELTAASPVESEPENGTHIGRLSCKTGPAHRRGCIGAWLDGPASHRQRRMHAHGTGQAARRVPWKPPLGDILLVLAA
jgi:hypothetical protein